MDRTTSPDLKEIPLGYGIYTTVIPHKSNVRVTKLKKIKLIDIDKDGKNNFYKKN